MTQSDLNRAVSRVTGETIDEIARRGFGMLQPLPHEPDPEDLIVDWDRAELERNVAIFRRAHLLRGPAGLCEGRPTNRLAVASSEGRKPRTISSTLMTHVQGTRDALRSLAIRSATGRPRSASIRTVVSRKYT